jgi:hypothetical protein
VFPAFSQCWPLVLLILVLVALALADVSPPVGAILHRLTGQL